MIQKHDGFPVCVKEQTALKLVEGGWARDIIRTAQPMDISSDIEHATSSYMDKVIPTLDDFKDTLSEPYDMNDQLILKPSNTS